MLRIEQKLEACGNSCELPLPVLDQHFSKRSMLGLFDQSFNNEDSQVGKIIDTQLSKETTENSDGSKND